MLAEANGLEPNERLTEGQRLEIPNSVKSGRLTADTHVIYDEGDIIGSTLPNLKSDPPDKGGCASLLMIIIMVVILIVVTVVTWGAATAAVGAGFMGIGAGMTAGVVAGAVVGAAAAAVGSIIQQGLFIALGYQDSFSWKEVASAAVQGMFSGAAAGVGAALQATKMTADAVVYAKVAAAALETAGAAGKQLIENGKITSWAGLAVAAVGGYLKAGQLSESGKLARGTAAFKASTNLQQATVASTTIKEAEAALSSIEKIQAVMDVVSPWVELAETAIRNDGKLEAGDWASAVGGTLGTALGQTEMGNTFWDKRAKNVLVGGAMAMIDRQSALEYLASSVGQEVGGWVGGGLESMMAGPSRKEQQSSGVGYESDLAGWGTEGGPVYDGVCDPLSERPMVTLGPGSSSFLEGVIEGDDVAVTDTQLVQANTVSLDDHYADVFASDLEGIFFQAAASDSAVQVDQQRFESGARATTRNYWEQVQENAVQEGSFAQYLFGGLMGKLGAAGHSIGETAAAMWNDPGSAAIGAGKGLVNLPADLFDGAVNLTKMSMDGWTYIAEDISHDYFGVEKGFFDDFRETDAYNFGHILDYSNQAEQGGGILAQIVAPAAVGKLAELKYARAGGEVVPNESVIDGLTELNPRFIRTTQTTTKQQGATLRALTESMRKNGFVVEPDKLIDVVRMPDGLTSLDTTRIVAADLAEVKIQARVHNFDDLLPNDEQFISRFIGRKGEVPTHWGEAVQNRISNQRSLFRNNYPEGSPFISFGKNY